MAVVEYGPLVSALRGSIDGVTFSSGGGVEIVKAKSRARNPIRSLQLPVKAAMQKWAPAWRALSGTVRGNWETYAATVTLTNSLGQDYQISGFAMFVRNSMVLELRGTPADANVPSDTGLPSVPTITLEYVSDDLRIASISPSVPSGGFIRGSVFTPTPASRNQSRGFVKDTFEYTNESLPFVISEDYAEGYSSAVEINAFVSIRYMDDDERISQEQILSLGITL